VLCLITIDSVLNFTAEVSDKTLDGPCSGITESANSVTFDLERKFLKHIDFGEIGIALLQTSEHVDHPASSLSAWCALTAALVLVELSEAENSVNNISLFIHDDYSSSTETTLHILKSVEVHQNIVADSSGQKGDR